MSLSAKAKEFAIKAELPQDAGAWFEANKICEVNDVALLAKAEELVAGNIIAVMVADKVQCALKVGEKVKILKFWIRN